MKEYPKFAGLPVFFKLLWSRKYSILLLLPIFTVTPVVITNDDIYSIIIDVIWNYISCKDQ